MTEARLNGLSYQNGVLFTVGISMTDQNRALKSCENGQKDSVIASVP